MPTYHAVIVTSYGEIGPEPIDAGDLASAIHASGRIAQRVVRDMRRYGSEREGWFVRIESEAGQDLARVPVVVLED